jgi:plastocyanin
VRRVRIYDAGEGEMRQKGIRTVRKRVVKLVLLCAAGLALGAAGFALAGTTTLSLTYAGPEPDTLTVPWGDTVRITNADTVAHSLVSSHGELQTGLVLPGKTFTTMITGPSHNYSFRQTGGKGFPGKIEVVFSGHVSLTSRGGAVDLGRAIRLSGTTSLHSTPVALQVHRRGDTHWTILTTVFSSSSGAYTANVRLGRGGKFRATVAAGQIRSAVRFVDVRPKLAAARQGGGLIAKLTPAGAASHLTLECLIGPGRWKRIASKRLGRAGIVSFPVRPGNGLVRVAATHSDARDGYAAQASRVLRAAC